MKLAHRTAVFVTKYDFVRSTLLVKARDLLGLKMW